MSHSPNGIKPTSQNKTNSTQPMVIVVKPEHDREKNQRSDEVNKSRSNKVNASGKEKINTTKQRQVEAMRVTEDVCADLETDDCYPECLKKTRHKTWFKVFLFLLIFGLDALDLVSDWLLYRDVVATEEGLVFGPPEKEIIISLLFFSILGSVTFVFEVVNLGFEIFKSNPWIDTDLCSAIIVWIEDVPQIILSVIIAACREEAISYFQLVKASVVILGCIIRIVIASINYCNKRSLCEARQKNAKSRLHTAYRVFIMLGLIIIFSGSIAVFMFTQSERNPDGSINFKVPHMILRGEYDDKKYFNNVSIYFSHPLFDYNTAGSIDPDPANWIRLMTIFDVQHGHADGLIKLQYDEATKSKLVIWQSGDNGNLNVEDCYTIDRSLQKLSISNCNSFLISGISEIIFKFHFVKPRIPGLVFGDITYNVKVNESGMCHDPNTSIVSSMQKRSTARTDAVMRYYRNKDSVSGGKHVIQTSTTDARFYNITNLIDIEMVWKTGFAYCTSTGSLFPHHDKNINVPC